MPQELKKPIGEVTHYYNKIGVAVVQISKKLNVGDVIRIVGGDVDFTQEVDSIEVDFKKVKTAPAKSSAGLKVKEKVRNGYKVYEV